MKLAPIKIAYQLLLSFTLLVLASSSVFAQGSPNTSYPNEFKLNVGWFIVDGTIEAAYEHFINSESSIGATAYYDGDSSDALGKFGIGPNFRVYFGKRYANGVYAEAFGLYYTGTLAEDVIPDMPRINQDFNTFALGFGIGFKLLTRSSNFSLDVNAALGRNLTQESLQDAFVGKGGISVGFRF